MGASKSVPNLVASGPGQGRAGVGTLTLKITVKTFFDKFVKKFDLVLGAKAFPIKRNSAGLKNIGSRFALFLIWPISSFRQYRHSSCIDSDFQRNTHQPASLPNSAATASTGHVFDNRNALFANVSM